MNTQKDLFIQRYPNLSIDMRLSFELQKVYFPHLKKLYKT